MEYMYNTKKIRLKTELLEKLGYSDGIILEIEDKKEVYKILSTDPNIIDWDIENETNDEGPERETDDYVVDFNTLATWVEAVWRLSKKSPAIVYGSDLFNAEVEKEFSVVGSEVASIEHLGIKTLLETFYNNSFEFAHEELQGRVKAMWKELPNHPSVISIIAKLLGK